MHERLDSRGQVIIEFLAFLTTMMAAMIAMMDEMIDLVQGLFGS